MAHDRILLDVTRTISRIGLGADTGVDRVEREWIKWAQSARWRSAQFVARLSGGVFAVDAEGLAAAMAASGWMDATAMLRRAKRPEVRRAESAFRRNASAIEPGAVYCNVGHSHLSPASIAAMRAAGAAKVLVKLHDAIPLDHPEFARPDGPEKMRARIEAAAGADGLIFNSAHTRERIETRMKAAPPAVVAPLGVVVPQIEAAPHGGFVTLGTIEPRKNHSLLLDIWSENAAALRDAPLHIIGRRGWMNEAVFRRLDAKPPGVFEIGDADDEAAMRRLAGARALLFPSFAEGYGLPLAEALALGVPVIAADIPALREVGGAAPDYVDPHDAEGWRAAILRFATSDEPAHAQAARIAHWRAPTWAAHFAAVDALLERL